MQNGNPQKLADLVNPQVRTQTSLHTSLEESKQISSRRVGDSSSKQVHKHVDKSIDLFI